MSEKHSGKPSFRRRQFLVDPEVQIGVSTHLIGWIYVYFLLFAVVANSSALFQMMAAETRGAAWEAAFDQIRAFARFVVVPMGLTFVAMAIHAVFLTHRLAGPIVRYKKALRDIAAHRLPSPITVREKDYFRDLADEMNAAVSALREDAARRRKVVETHHADVKALVESLERHPDDIHGALTRAYAALDGAERALRACSDAGPQTHPVPLPEKELPPVREDATAAA